MNYTVKGTITAITEVEVLASGAAKLSYRIDTGDQYNNLWEFEIYKGVDHVEHAHNFAKYNKVGDAVKVSFNVSTNEWQGKYFTSLDAWKVFKADNSKQKEEVAVEEEGDLPF